MHVMRVDWNPVNEERKVPVRFSPGPEPRPAVEEPEVAEEQPEAKVVRPPRRKSPRGLTGVQAKDV